MMQLCLQESRRRYIKEVTLCCEDVKNLDSMNVKITLIINQREKTSKEKYKEKFSQQTTEEQ